MPDAGVLRGRIRGIPDFPRPGILFRDLTPLLLDPDVHDTAIAGLVERAAPLAPDVVVAAEARGFLFGATLARELRAGFVPARKPGKLPHATVQAEYELEYGVDALHVHADAIAHGERVLVHDDLLATGGTARALCELVEQLGGRVVGCLFVVELAALGGRDRLAPFPVQSLVSFEDG